MLFSSPGMFPSPLLLSDLVNSCWSLTSQLTCYLLREAFLTSPTRSTDICLYNLYSMVHSSTIAPICPLVFVTVFIWLMPIFSTKCSPTLYKLHRAWSMTQFIMVSHIPGSRNICGRNEWVSELLSRAYKRNLELIFSVTAFLVACGLLLFPFTHFPPLECSHFIGETGKTMPLGQNMVAFTLWIMCVTEIVTIMFLWVRRHGPWLQIFFPNFFSWWVWTHCCIANALKNCSDREWFTSVNAQMHRAASWPSVYFHLAQNWLSMNFFLVTQVKTCWNRHTGPTKSFLECLRLPNSLGALFIELADYHKYIEWQTPTPRCSWVVEMWE